MSWLEWLSTTTIAVWMRESDSIWGYPTILFLHTLGLGILVGFAAAIDFRVLGFAEQLPLAPLARFFPVIWLGFWINAVSGALLLIMTPAKAANPTFLVKMVCIALGVVNLWLLKRHLFRPVQDQASAIPFAARVLAISSLVLWTGAITAGRLMAYIGNVSRF
jgi:hypothetical protein